ncbi:hypothetical protein [Sphingomonas rubra]|nr:hypothetical protein [Sphingomonas rubra]
MIRTLLLAAAVPLAAAPSTAAVQTPLPAADAALPAYADMADLVLAAPVIADATIRSTARIKGAEAVGLAPGKQRFYVEADVASLIRGAAGLPARIGYLVDVRLDARGRAPRLRKERVLIFARTVPNASNQLQLVATDAQLDWSAALDARVREIARAALAADAPPTITGIGSAFHVAGSLPGEGETQVFVQTADKAPVSLSILRRPGEQPRWSVALGEIVDEGAGPPARDTLLWYRLACGLPRALPATSVSTLSPEDAEIAAEDYRFVIDALGPCARSRAISGDRGPA